MNPFIFFYCLISTSLFVAGCTVIVAKETSFSPNTPLHAKHNPDQTHKVEYSQITMLLNQLENHFVRPKPQHPVIERRFKIDVPSQPARHSLNIAKTTNLPPHQNRLNVPELEQFPSHAELYCFGSGCQGSYFTGLLTIIIDKADNKLVFDNINLTSNDGHKVFGSITFDLTNELDRTLIESLILFRSETIDTMITGQSSAVLDYIQGEKPSAAAFQLRDKDHDVILDLYTLFFTQQ